MKGDEVYILKSPGRIIVDPVPLTGHINKMFEPFWVMVIVPGDICNYYRYQLKTRYGLKLQQPGWGSHISVISGETIFNANYDSIIRTTKNLFKSNKNSTVSDVYLNLLDSGLICIEELGNWQRLKNKYHKKEIEFEYEIGPKTIGKHWWLKVKSEELKNIRSEFGYQRDGYWGLHLTLGNPHPLHTEHSSYIYNIYKKFKYIN